MTRQDEDQNRGNPLDVADRKSDILEIERNADSDGNSSSSKTCVLILGMPYSGGAELAGVFNLLGCDLPKSAEPPQSDPAIAQNVRSQAIKDFNDELLAAAGSTRDDFTPFNKQWSSLPSAQTFTERALKLLAIEFADSQFFILEDPGNCYLASFWVDTLDRFGCVVKPVLVTRSPIEIGHLLHSGQTYTNAHGQLLWLRYMLDAEAQTRGMQRVFTNFNQLVDHWDIVAQTSQKSLNLVWPRPIANMEFEIARFLDQSKQSSDSGKDENRATKSPLVAEWVHDSHEIFERWVRDGENDADYETLDQIRMQFDTAARAFARLIKAEQDQMIKFRKQIDALPILQKERDSALESLAEKETEHAEMEHELQESKREITLLDAEVFRQREELAVLAQLAARNEDRAVQMNEDKDELKRKLYWERGQKELINNELNSMRRMFSWKITAPLRKSGRLLRRLTGRGSNRPHLPSVTEGS